MPTTFLLLPPLEFDDGEPVEVDAVVPSVMPCLPTDILLEIFLRTDPATLFRCAATSKDHLCRVADPTFLRQYAHRLDNCFVPSLLLGLYCVFVDDDSNGDLLLGLCCVFVDNDSDEDKEDDDQSSVQIMVPPGPAPAATPCRSLVEDTVSTLNHWNYTPAASCAGLLFAKDSYTGPNLVKGRVIHTSSRSQSYTSISTVNIVNSVLVLLPDDHEEENDLVNFRVVNLILTRTPNQGFILRAQIFRSRSRKWDWDWVGEPMEVSLPCGSPSTWHDTKAAVVIHTDVGATANWLCKSKVSYHIVSFHIDDVQAGVIVNVIELPPGCQDPERNSVELLLAPSPDRKRLTLLDADGLMINVWTRTTNSTATSCWARQLLVDVAGELDSLGQRCQLAREVDLGARIKFERWFGERSGTAVLEIDRCGHFALNLATKKLQLVKEFSETGNMRLLCGHEINPLPLLRKLQLHNRKSLKSLL